MPRPPGSASLAPSDAAVLSVIAAAGVNALAAVYPAASIPAAVVSVVQGTLSLLPRKSDLDPQGLTRQIGEALKQMGLQKNTLQWAVNRASEILLRYGSKPVNHIRARVKDARPEAVWMAQQALDDAKGSDLDPGEGEERRHTLQVLRIYYDVYLHHEKGLAEITTDVLVQLSDQIGELKTELRSFTIELLANDELRKAERNCYIPGGLPPPELSLRSITAKYGVIPFYDTQRFNDVYERIKQAKGPVLLVITGEGGSGKTRFALELGKKLQDNDGWRYCFLTENKGGGDFEPLFASDKAPFFIVADYAHRTEERVKQLVADAVSARWYEKKLVLTLIDRNEPRYSDDLTRRNISDPDGVGRAISFERFPLQLPPLGKDHARKLFEVSVEALKNSYKTTDDALDIDTAWKTMPESVYNKPLNVVLGALLMINGKQAEMLDNEKLLEDALYFEVKDRWLKKLNVLKGGLSKCQQEEYEVFLKLLAAYVVFRGGAQLQHLKHMAEKLLQTGKYNYLSEGTAQEMAMLICEMLRSRSEGDVKCAPLEPDPVADYLIRSLYYDKNNREMLAYIIYNIVEKQISSESTDKQDIQKLEYTWEIIMRAFAEYGSDIYKGLDVAAEILTMRGDGYIAYLCANIAKVKQLPLTSIILAKSRFLIIGEKLKTNSVKRKKILQLYSDKLSLYITKNIISLKDKLTISVNGYAIVKPIIKRKYTKIHNTNTNKTISASSPDKGKE